MGLEVRLEDDVALDVAGPVKHIHCVQKVAHLMAAMGHLAFHNMFAKGAFASSLKVAVPEEEQIVALSGS